MDIAHIQILNMASFGSSGVRLHVVSETAHEKFTRFIKLFTKHHHACREGDLDFTTLPSDSGVMTFWFCHHCTFTMQLWFSKEDWAEIRAVAAEWDVMDEWMRTEEHQLQLVH